MTTMKPGKMTTLVWETFGAERLFAETSPEAGILRALEAQAREMDWLADRIVENATDLHRELGFYAEQVVQAGGAWGRDSVPLDRSSARDLVKHAARLYALRQTFEGFYIAVGGDRTKVEALCG